MFMDVPSQKNRMKSRKREKRAAAEVFQQGTEKMSTMKNVNKEDSR